MPAGVEEIISAYPRALIDHDNLPFYRGLLDRSYFIWRCQACGRWYVPPRSFCPRCWSDDVAPTAVSGAGTLFMWTLVRQPAMRWNILGTRPREPSWVITGELVEQLGLRVTLTAATAPLTPPRIGTPLRMTWSDLDGVPYPVFALDVDARAQER